MSSTVLVIGGGAAGLTAAIAAARAGAGVTLLERDERVGRKILASGNGRCNLTNVSVTPEAYNQPVFVEPVLGRYDCVEVLSFFSGMGLLTAADAEGRVYPVSNAAASVLDVLRLECARCGVDVRTGVDVAQLTHAPGVGLEARSRDGRSYRAGAVIVATCTGSLLEGMGHDMIPESPVLGPVRTRIEPIRGLSGVRVRCAASLVSEEEVFIARERGELLFRDYGVSGIMIFDLSRYLQPGCVLELDLLPDTTADELGELIAARCEQLSWRTAETFFAGMLHDRVARAVLRAAGVGAHTPVEHLPQAALVDALKRFRLPVTGMGEAAQSQVTRGGAAVDGFDAGTLESRHAAGLYAAGEILDVDGRCGGFNLHWAWASGIVAGEAAALRVTGTGGTV